MNIILYSRSKDNSKVDTSTEGICPRIALMYAKRFSVYNFYSHHLLYWRTRGSWSEQFYCELFEKLFCHGKPGSDDSPGSCLEFHKALKRYRKVKNKNRESLVLLNQAESQMKKIMKTVTVYYEGMLNQHHLLPLMPFEKEPDVFIPMPSDEYTEDSPAKTP